MAPLSRYIFFLIRLYNFILMNTKTNHSLAARILKGGMEFDCYEVACLSISNKKQQLDFALFYVPTDKVDV